MGQITWASCLSLLVLFKINLNFQIYVCNVWHGVMQNSLNFHDLEIIIVGKNDYKVHFGVLLKVRVRVECRMLIWSKKVDN